MDPQLRRTEPGDRATRIDEPVRPPATLTTDGSAAALPGAEDQLVQLKAEIESLAQDVAKRGADVGALQVEISKLNLAWYRDTSVIVALLALVFSFGTTAVSYYRTQQQDIHDARAELRGFLQRLIALPGETDTRSSPAVNAENRLIANQAAEVMDRIPKYVSALEYNLVAGAFMSSSAFDRAEDMLKRALSVSSNVEEEVAALRQYGTLLYAAGKLENGKDMFRRALDVHKKYPSNYPTYPAWTNAQTEVHWASAEFMQRNRDGAKKHLAKARELAGQLPYGSGTTNLLMQIAQADHAVKEYNLNPALPGLFATPNQPAPTR